MTPSSPEEAPASPTPRIDAACGSPSSDWEATAHRLYDEGVRLEGELSVANLALQLSSPHEKALIADANRHREEASALRQRLEAAELDTKRLEWLDAHIDLFFGSPLHVVAKFNGLRSAIDEALSRK